MTIVVREPQQLNLLDIAVPSTDGNGIPLLSGTAVEPSRDSNPVHFVENSTQSESSSVVQNSAQHEKGLPTLAKVKSNLPDGWHRTEKFGDVFINNGKAWGVKIIGDRMENIIVDITEKDILGNDHAFLRKDALRKQAEYARTKVLRRKAPQQTAQQVSTSTDGVREAS